MNDKVNKRAELVRLKDSLVDDLLAQSDDETVRQAIAEGVSPDEARSRVLGALLRARECLTPKHKPSLVIDATRARNILRRVAQRPPSDAPAPLLEAAQFEAKKDDTEVLKVVEELRVLGVVSDDELK